MNLDGAVIDSSVIGGTTAAAGTFTTLTANSNTTIGGTLGVTGVVTANAGVVVDNITIDGTEIDLSSGDLTIDAAGRIDLSADDNGEIRFFDGSLMYGQLKEDSSNLVLQSLESNKDLIFRGNDDGTEITALTLDMSDAGSAYFNNKVGIGTSTVNEILHVHKSATPRILLTDSTTGTTAGSDGAFIGLSGSQELNLWNYENTSIRFATNNTERVRVDSSGKLGIGTASPAHNLHVQGASNDDARIRIENSGAGQASFDLENTEGYFRMFTDAGSWRLYDQTDGEYRLFVDTSGNVGINTSSPSQLLHISSTDSAGIYLEADSDNVNEDHVAEFHMSSDGGATYHKLGTNNDNNGYINVSEALVFERQGTEKMRMNSSGRLGIGTTSPSQQLESKTSSAIYTIGATNSHGSTPRGLKIEYSGSAPDSTADYFIYCEDTAAVRMYVASDGDVYTSDSGILTSDRSLKTDIADATSKLADINQLQVKNFKWTTDYHPNKQNKHIGFIADEFETVFPGLVRETENPIKGQDGTVKSIKYGALIPILVKALQEADNKIDALEARITALES